MSQDAPEPAQRGRRQSSRRSGLTSARAKRPRRYDRSASRIIFPIRDASGAAVGLGGRDPVGRGDRATTGQVPQLPGDAALRQEPHALPDRPGQGRDAASAAQAVLVEGYTDALMAHQAGFENVVARLGTALTPGQVALVTRYARGSCSPTTSIAAGQSAGTSAPPS